MTDKGGMKLIVNGHDFMINGMNWDYIPIGTNTVNADFWNKPDDIIKAALDNEMSLLKNMNVNVIRQYTGVPARWISYIYENYGIYTVLNHSFGRYGLMIDGVWVPITDYSNPKTAHLLLSEIDTMVRDYHNTPGLLMYLLGNENNYGLFWAGAETEDFPDDEEEKNFIGEKRGRPMYRLMNEAARKMKELDTSHPVAICNGDLLFIDIIAEECKDVDIYGTNTYRGASFGDIFQVVKDKLNKPIMFTEFGADAYNAIKNEEDQKMQAYYLVQNWLEIYENAAGLGKVENSIGGFTFQFSDGWWKYGFNDRENADVHDNNASWANGGYLLDFQNGENNMNEEWFGICAKGPTNSKGLYNLYPRAAYYALKKVHNLNPYASEMTNIKVNQYFDDIQIMEYVLQARGDKAALEEQSGAKIRLSQLRAELTGFYTGGSLLSTPSTPDPDNNVYPDKTGFDQMQSYYIGVEGQPTPDMRAEINFNIIGNVATNPLNEIFYENVARPVTVNSPNGPITLTDNNKLRVYNAEYEWKTKIGDIKGFYRTGHYHWGYEGDFFGLYPEANYGPNLDIYNGEILGAEFDGKGKLKGFSAAVGPQLWWGANPAALLKYRAHFKGLDITGIYHRDFKTDIELDGNGLRTIDINKQRSGVIQPWPTERATLVLEKEIGNFGFTVGGIWGGSPLNGIAFPFYDEATQIAYTDFINADDNWGGKAKITFTKGKFNWYALGATAGLVANGGVDQTQTFTGWKLKDNGSGNQNSFLTGFTYTFGNLQIAPNFLWQEPLVAATPNNAGGAARLRNILVDPFVVRSNRKTTAGELLLTYDPTPGSWFYAWDSDRTEDAKLAFNLGFVYRHLPTTMDAHIGFLADRSIFAFPNSVPAKDLWETSSRIVSKVSSDLGLIANLYVGNGQSNGSDSRMINRFGLDLRAIYKKYKIEGALKVNDWGPFDYHRDFNLTYPLQLMLDISTSIGKPDWFILPDTKIGIRGTWRSLDKFSPRYLPTQVPPNTYPPEPILSPVGFDNGQEWEIRTYLRINLGK